ncbi:MAG: metal-dependent hydrolase [Balneolaceae bacterium]
MDPLAHTLFGAVLAETGLKRRTALATATLVIGANLPDVDALAMFHGSDTALHLRRGWTHGVLALVLFPFLLTGGMILADRLHTRWRARNAIQRSDIHPIRRTLSIEPKWLLILSFLSVWSHPLLDWLNTYGIRLFMPFDETWYYGDTLFIIDPWFWLLTGAMVVFARSTTWLGISGWLLLGSALSVLVFSTSMVPLMAKILWGTGILIIALIRYFWYGKLATRPMTNSLVIATLLYVAIMLVGSRLTVRHAKMHLANQGIEIHEAMSRPLPARPLLRNGIAVSETHYYRFRLNWLIPDSFELRGDPVSKTEPNPLVDIALNTPELKGFRNWIRYPVYEVKKVKSGWRVYIHDLRYSAPNQNSPSGIGMAIVDLDQNRQVRTVQVF